MERGGLILLVLGLLALGVAVDGSHVMVHDCSRRALDPASAAASSDNPVVLGGPAAAAGLTAALAGLLAPLALDRQGAEQVCARGGVVGVVRSCVAGSLLFRQLGLFGVVCGGPSLVHRPYQRPRSSLTPAVRTQPHQVGSVVKSRLFDRPKAFVLLNLAGVAPGGCRLALHMLQQAGIVAVGWPCCPATTQSSGQRWTP